MLDVAPNGHDPYEFQRIVEKVRVDLAAQDIEFGIFLQHLGFIQGVGFLQYLTGQRIDGYEQIRKILSYSPQL